MNLATPAAWCAALFLASTLFSHTVALRLILLLCGIALIAADASIRRTRGAAGGPISYLPPLALPFALWAAWSAASLLWTIEPELTRKELRNEIGYACGALWMCYVAAQAPRAPRILIPTLAAGALAVCVVALRELSAEAAIAFQLHGGPGAFSSTLLVLFPCTLAWTWYAAGRGGPKGWMLPALVLLPLQLAAGYATQNRTLWIGFAAEAAIFAALLLFRGQPAAQARRLRAAVAGATLLFLIGAALTLGRVQVERVAASPAAAADPRPALWQSVLRRVEERPLLGAGFGRGIERKALRAEFGDFKLWHSHNLFLDAAVQLGWPGLALLALLFAWTATLAWRLARSADDAAFACGLALLPLIAGTLLRNMTDVLWVRQSALLYWGAVGVLLAWGLRSRAPAGR